MMTTKARLHQFIEALPDNRLGRTAALARLVRFVSESMPPRELVIITSRDTIASRRLAHRCGCVEAGAP